MKLQIYSHRNLGEKREHKRRYEFGMSIRRKLTALVLVPEEVAYEGKDGAGCLDGYMPFGPYYPQDHSCGKQDAPGHGLHKDMSP